MNEPKVIKIDNVEYVRKDSMNQDAEKFEGMPYVIIRTYSAGVHAGYLKEKDGKMCTLINSRRIHYWEGAASLSQMAMEGVNKPDNCRFPCEVGILELTEAIEYLYCTEKAKLSIQGVKVWAK